MKKVLTLLVFTLLFITVGCATGETQGSGQANYEETKKMVVDILQTEEGKKAIKDLMADSEIKKALIMEQTFVKDSITAALTSEEASTFWEKQFEDPKFAESFAKSIQKEHEELIKNLMKDPDYQKSLLEIFKDPQLKEEMLTVLKSQEFRAHLQTVMTETFESPLFKAKIQELLITGAEEMQKGKAATEGGGEQKEEGS